MALTCKGCIDIRHCKLINRKYNKRCDDYFRSKKTSQATYIPEIKDWVHIDKILSEYGIYKANFRGTKKEIPFSCIPSIEEIAYGEK